MNSTARADLQACGLLFNFYLENLVSNIILLKIMDEKW